jgi:transglutaminase-like putative cysteine protease
MLQEANVTGRHDADVARVAQQWVQRHIRYLREYPETYASPLRTLAWEAGDCDDQVILLASLLRGAKIPTRAAFAFWRSDQDGQRKGHVWTDFYDREAHRWVPLETVRPVKYGWSPYDFLKGKPEFQWFGAGDPITGPR